MDEIARPADTEVVAGPAVDVPETQSEAGAMKAAFKLFIDYPLPTSRLHFLSFPAHISYIYIYIYIYVYIFHVLRRSSKYQPERFWR